MDAGKTIRTIADFPKAGINFYDISTLLRDAKAWRSCLSTVEQAVRDMQPDMLFGVEARGFLLAAPLSLHLDIGFAMIRKKGKLPGATIGLEYEKEYGTDILEIQEDAIKPGMKVVVLDDVLATGGTMAASVELLRVAGAQVMGVAVILELDGLNGRDQLDCPVFALAKRPG